MTKFIKLGVIVLSSILTFNTSNDGSVFKTNEKNIENTIQETTKKKGLATSNSHSININGDYAYAFKDYDDEGIQYTNSYLKELSTQSVKIFSSKNLLIES